MASALQAEVAAEILAGGQGASESLTIEEMEHILKHWEALDGVKWDDETKLECAEAVSTYGWSVDKWKEMLVKVPADVNDRYRKVMTMLLDKKLIDQSDYDEEVKAMDQFSPATLMRRGKNFADWYRQSNHNGLY